MTLELLSFHLKLECLWLCDGYTYFVNNPNRWEDHG